GDAGREDEPTRRVGNFIPALRAEVLGEPIRRLRTDAELVLREDRLEEAAMINTVAAADGEMSRITGEPAQQPAIGRGRPGKTEARLDVVLVVAEAVLEAVLDLLGRADVLVAHAQIEREVAARCEFVLKV